MSLKSEFFKLLERQFIDVETVSDYFNEIEKSHSEKRRVYHGLKHLESIFLELEPVKTKIKDWDTLSFSVFYHDIIYNVKKKDNEEKSAQLAYDRLTAINYPDEKALLCHTQIIATKGHSVSKDNDTNYFTDADLSILGKSWEHYTTYYNAIRKEYKIYPDFLYNPARKKVLRQFLEMEFIYKTDFFRNKYEIQAKKNLTKELELL